MTKAVVPGYAETINSSQIPTTATFETIPSPINKGADGLYSYIFDQIVGTSADIATRFVAPETGAVLGLLWANGATALDGTNGIRIRITNKTNSDGELADFGMGSATNAAAANDTSTTLAANASLELANANATNSVAYFNKGDVIVVTGTRDGTAITGTGTLILQLGSQGR